MSKEKQTCILKHDYVVSNRAPPKLLNWITLRLTRNCISSLKSATLQDRGIIQAWLQ